MVQVTGEEPVPLQPTTAPGGRPKTSVIVPRDNPGAPVRWRQDRPLVRRPWTRVLASVVPSTGALHVVSIALR